MDKVSRRVLVLPLLLGLLLTLGACSPEKVDAVPQKDEPVVIKPPGTPNEYLLAVGELEPNFGGFFLGDQSRLTVYLLNVDTASQEEKDSVVRTLGRVYGEDLLSSARLPAKFLKSAYGMVDLYTWYAKLGELYAIDEIAQTVEISFTDLDEGRNRIALGVLEASMIPALQRGLTQLEIPVDAVIIEEEGYACAAIGWSPIVARVRDADGKPTAIGTTVTIRKQGYEASEMGSGDPLEIYVGDSEGGVYDVEVTKPYYDSATVENVDVIEDECRYSDSVPVDVTLTLQPDAPPVRQVVVPTGTWYYGDGNITEQVTALVEADPGISREVTWASSDPGVATITPTGKLTAMCRTSLGTATLTATSVAEPSKQGSFNVEVSAADPSSGRCP